MDGNGGDFPLDDPAVYVEMDDRPAIGPRSGPATRTRVNPPSSDSDDGSVRFINLTHCARLFGLLGWSPRPYPGLPDRAAWVVATPLSMITWFPVANVL